MKHILIIMISFLLNGCLSMPETVTPIQKFELDKYLGTWYEIARLDHSFERGLTKVSAEYTLRKDGGVSVLNRGFSQSKGEWKEAEGKAYFVNSADEGFLKVSFFGPFYGSYIIFDVDKKNYQYAFVSGPNVSYLWLLSRTPDVKNEVREKFMKRSQELGFDTENLIWVEH
ncbi:lipocalin family protein [Desulforhopalus vacuolatus]|uniref:lipocalin family protein n=1 Tax=Desulforhopalus vacuolatus TaxID=40414 RepID=UPI001965C82F|nr:lipocalin family protein [Desulforhopalus vacuolatus]MBM9519649.1 lipocalin family protein [Desulforhopalus vacuolatus]